MDKAELRKQMIKARLDLDSITYTAKSNFIINKLKSNPAFIKAKTIGIYVSFNQEVDTIALITEMLGKKNICVPKIEGKEMNFYLIDSLQKLKANRMGILEPDNKKLVLSDQIDLMIVPLVGYDKNNNRLGYGGGYYDRYLKNYNQTTIGLAFSFQMVDCLPVEPFDLPIDVIINEKYD